jgi:hypothetical protein
VIIVPDAGPLIYLGGAGHLELLRTLYAEVVVPRIVVDEIVIAGAGLTGAREVAAATWIRVEEVAPVRRFFAWRVSFPETPLACGARSLRTGGDGAPARARRSARGAAALASASPGSASAAVQCRIGRRTGVGVRVAGRSAFRAGRGRRRDPRSPSKRLYVNWPT